MTRTFLARRNSCASANSAAQTLRGCERPQPHSARFRRVGGVLQLTAGTTTLAQTRAADGSRDPYNVTYWGIGNESWGCGGDFRPEEYALEFRRFTSWVPDYGLKLNFIASGAGTSERDPQVAWTRGFMENLVAKNPGLLGRVFGLGMHYYCGTTGKGDSLEYSDADWYQMLWQANVMDSLVAQHWLAMGDYDKERKVKLLVDEWGAWHETSPLGPTYLFNYIPCCAMRW